MELRNNQIIGYKRFKNKEGIERLVVSVAKTPTARDLKFGCVGMCVEDVWMPEHLFELFDSSVIGMVAEFSYQVSGRYADVVDVRFLD